MQYVDYRKSYIPDCLVPWKEGVIVKPIIILLYSTSSGEIDRSWETEEG